VIDSQKDKKSLAQKSGCQKGATTNKKILLEDGLNSGP